MESVPRRQLTEPRQTTDSLPTDAIQLGLRERINQRTRELVPAEGLPWPTTCSLNDGGWQASLRSAGGIGILQHQQM